MTVRGSKPFSVLYPRLDPEVAAWLDQACPPVGADTGERFLADVKDHTMQVAHDDQLYRHLRFRAPGTSSYWFELLTWPGNLLINGDMGSYHLRRESDMIAWVGASGRSNPGYWAQKIASEEARNGLRPYSPEAAGRLVLEPVVEFIDEHLTITPDDEGLASEDLADSLRAEALDLLRAVKDELLDVAYEETELRAALDHFSWTSETGDELRFTDTWEWDLREDSYHWLWCCEAIAWGVRAYLRGVVSTVSTVTGPEVERLLG